MKIKELLNEMDPRSEEFENLPEDEQWLARYTYESLNKWPSDWIRKSLLSKYKNKESIRIFRGMNFDTEEQFKKFMASAKDNTFTTNSISSWAKSASAARQFAMTKPTYFLNRSVVSSYGKMRDEKEAISGYRGVILTLRIPAGVAIDVDQSGVGHESEIVLLPGTYKLDKIIEVKRYADQIKDKDKDINTVILNWDFKKNKGRENSFYEYILKHHSNELSNASREKIFRLMRVKLDKVFSHVYNWTGDNKAPEHSISVPGGMLYVLEQGYLTPLHKKIILNDISKYTDMVTDYLEKNKDAMFSKNTISQLRVMYKLVGKEHILNNLAKRIVGKKYHDLGDEVFNINKIEDPREHQRAMDAYMKKLEQILGQM